MYYNNKPENDIIFGTQDFQRLNHRQLKKLRIPKSDSVDILINQIEHTNHEFLDRLATKSTNREGKPPLPINFRIAP